MGSRTRSFLRITVGKDVEARALVDAAKKVLGTSTGAE